MIGTPAHPGTAKEFTDTVSVAGEEVGRKKITEILNHSPPRQKVFSQRQISILFSVLMEERILNIHNMATAILWQLFLELFKTSTVCLCNFNHAADDLRDLIQLVSAWSLDSSVILAPNSTELRESPDTASV